MHSQRAVLVRHNNGRDMQQSPARSRLVVQILGRAENVVGFIRRGESEAWTEIHLSGGSGRPDVVILRKMKIADKVRADGTEYQGVDSTWRINGALPYINITSCASI